MRELLREVLEVLDRHHGADALERSHLQAMRRLANMPGDPTRRDYWDPGHFTASAFVVSPDRSSLLLIKHKKLGRWLQPGGHIEAEDTTVESAARR
ncbi:MAG TPA: hypothetical protein DCQ06_06275 [Myxococcales bacterium]|nr:hypothetical protein [Myxococcales bacterium]